MPRYEIETPIDFVAHPSPGCGYTPKAGDARLDWWRAARFGMFLHWGLYAIPAGIWRGRNYKFIGEWIMQQAKIPVAEYEQLAAQFDPRDYDPDGWAQLAVESGAKYVVFTAKHHDGFALFDSPSCDWNVVERTPGGKDLLASLADACRRRGLKLGFYYSQDIDWRHPHGAGNDWDYPDAASKDIARYLREKVKPQLRELLTNYGPVAMLWFDTPVSVSPEQSQDLADFVHELQPECLVSGRIGHNAGDYGSLEDNAIPNGPVKGDWEMPATMNQTWGYKALDKDWKSPSELIRQLADLAGKGVNYLLNIGPDADGRIPQESVDRMRLIGGWLETHGEAIYDTEQSPFPYAFPWGSITQRAGKLYLLIEEWPKGPLELPGLKNAIRGAYAMGAEGASIEHERIAVEGLVTPLTRLTLPPTAPNPHVSCVVLEVDGRAAIDPTPLQGEDGVVRIASQLAKLETPAGSAEAVVGPSDLIEQWKSPDTRASWSFGVTKPGEFDVWVVTGAVAAHVEWIGGHTVTIEIEGQRLRGELTPDRASRSRRSAYFPEMATNLGRVRLDRKGESTLEMMADPINEAAPDGLCLAAILLEPVAS